MAKKRKSLVVRIIPSLLAISMSGYVFYQVAGEDLKAKLENDFFKGKFVTEATVPEVDEIPTIPVDYNPVSQDTEPTEEVSTEIEEPVEVIIPESRNTTLLRTGYPLLNVNAEEYNNINEDYVGFIQIPNTSIEYPVFQGTDNDFYLHHGMDGKDLARGTIYVDYRNDLSLGDDSSTVQNNGITLYGHHMKDGTMFRDLMKFKDPTFFNNNRYYAFYNEDGSVYGVEVFACYVTSGATSQYTFIQNIDDEETLNTYLEYVNANAINSRDIDINVGDKLVMLVTCSYEHDNYRCVVVGKATRQIVDLDEIEEIQNRSK